MHLYYIITMLTWNKVFHNRFRYTPKQTCDNANNRDSASSASNRERSEITSRRGVIFDFPFRCFLRFPKFSNYSVRVRVHESLKIIEIRYYRVSFSSRAPLRISKYVNVMLDKNHAPHIKQRDAFPSLFLGSRWLRSWVRLNCVFVG